MICGETLGDTHRGRTWRDHDARIPLRIAGKQSFVVVGSSRLCDLLGG
jgi:hypothetical protein